MRGETRPVMREPVLVSIDADQILHRERDAGLLVGLHLQAVDDEVGVQDGLRHQVLVAPA